MCSFFLILPPFGYRVIKHGGELLEAKPEERPVVSSNIDSLQLLLFSLLPIGSIYAEVGEEGSGEPRHTGYINPG
ncbi:hypothetical protein AGIG_G6415 [Arapaima gigas]